MISCTFHFIPTLGTIDVSRIEYGTIKIVVIGSPQKVRRCFMYAAQESFVHLDCDIRCYEVIVAYMHICNHAYLGMPLMGVGPYIYICMYV